MPSLRLLTKPAWLTLERFGSRSVVSQKTSLGLRSLCGVSADSSAACWLVSRTRRTESARPIAANATPG